LGVASKAPLYVLDLDPVANRVLVGDESQLGCQTFTIDRCNWIPFETPTEPFEATVKIRYHHPGTPVTVTPLPGARAQLALHDPQRAVTPGQAAVLYRDDLVLGGGWISR